MKKTILMLGLLTSILFSFNINLKLTDIKNTEGKMYIGLYNRAEGFTEILKTFKLNISDIQSSTVMYTFQDISFGEYAISVFHDENNNGILDTNMFGVPKEDYGFSKNNKFLLRSATFEESMFSLKNDQNIIIKVGD